MMQLTIQNLTKTYPGRRGSEPVQALNNVSLSIGQGLFGLLGQNGAGKSSLMRTIATLQPPDDGQILFNDLDVLARPDEFRQILGYLPQEFGVYPTATADELLDHIADLKGYATRADRRFITEDLLRRVNLWDVRQRPLGTFSGGMRQRFGIAQALVGEPEVIIVDEPTAGLDPAERNRFYNLLAEIGENTVVLLSTHLVEDVSTLCGQMAILNRGTVLAVGEPRLLMSQLTGQLWEKPIPKTELDGHQTHFVVISHRYFSGQLFVTILANNQPDRASVAKTPTLEDAYFAAIR